MKKIIIATMSLFMSASMLSACAPKEEDKENTGTTVTTTEVTEDTNGESENGGAEVPPEMDFPANKNTASGEIAKVIGTTGEWTAMIPVLDETELKEYYLLNPADYKSMSVNTAQMSASFAEIIVVEAQYGKVNDAVKALEARKQKLIDQDAYYPMHQEMAADTIVDSEGNFAFLIVGSSDDKAALEAAKKAIKG